MNSLNSILIEGNLTRDPDLRTTPSGTPVCVFSVASNRWYKQNENLEKEVSFFDIEAWARLGEACGEQLKKGRGVRIVGRLKQDRWNDTEGKPHSKVKIVAEHVEFKPVFNHDGAAGQAEEDSGAEVMEARPGAEVMEARPGAKAKQREPEPVF